MMLNKANYQTAVIEMAIEELTRAQIGKRTQVNEFDVRHTLDNLREKTWVTTGWKQDPDCPEKNIPIRKQAADIWQYSESTIQTVLAQVKSNYSKDKTKYQFERKGELNAKVFKDFVESLKIFAPMVKAEDVPNFVQSLLETVYYAQTMDKRNTPQKINVLFSPVKGGGKSTFLNEWLRTAEEAGVYAGRGELPLRMDSNADVTPWTRNVLTVDQDIQYQPDMMFFMAAGRKEEVQIAQKYAKPYLADCISETWAATNLFLKQDRVLNVINCNSYDVESLKREFENEFEKVLRIPPKVTLYNIWSYTISQTSQISQIKLLFDNIDCLEELDAVENENLRKYARIPDIAYLLETIQKVKSCPIDFTRASVAQLTNFADTPAADVNKVRARLSRILKKMYSQGLIKLVGRGAIEYEKWDVYSLLEVKAEDLFSSDVQEETTVFDEIAKTREAYDKLIAHARDFFPPFLKGSDEKLDSKEWTICNTFDKVNCYNSEGDQVVVNKGVSGKSRKNEEVHQQNFLFECDPPKEVAEDPALLKTALKEQVDRIENAPKELKDSILWTCYTGGKSIHVVVHTNLKDEDMRTKTGEYDTGLRKYIHQKLNEKYFEGKADPSGQNAGRLARAPNAIRQDRKHPGKKQVCLQFNMSAKALDVSSLVEDYKEEKRLSQTIKELTAKPPLPEEMRKEPSIHNLEDLKAWNTKVPSKAKQECIEFLEGTLQDWNRCLACVRELRIFGFTDYEIESEGPANDRWIKAALKAVH